MRTLFLIAWALLAPIAARAGATIEKQLASPWDSIRFAAGILSSDYYTDRPIMVLYKTAEGGVLMIYDTSKTTSQVLNKTQVTALVTRLTTFFAGAAAPPAAETQFKPPALHMLLSIDRGFMRSSFFKDDHAREPALVHQYLEYLRELAGRN